MTDADIIGLTVAGIEADIIIDKIRSAPSTAFDTSVDALKVLKAAGVANEVMLNMVTDGTPAAPGTSEAGSTTIDMTDFKEPVMKEGLWEERTSSTTHPGDPSGSVAHSTCHSHAYDHAMFQKLMSFGSGESSNKSSNGGIRTSDTRPEMNCALTGAAVEDEKQVVEFRCQGHGRTFTSKTAWKMIDDDHAHSESTMVYNPPVAGMSTLYHVSEFTFKGPCPAGASPGGIVVDPRTAYRGRSKSTH